MRLGQVKSVFWRRLGLIFFFVPLMIWGFAGPVIWHFPGVLFSALAEAWTGFREEFRFQYGSQGFRILNTVWTQLWAKDYVPSDPD